MKMKKSKRGSQVEFVISFILFVTFVVFVYILLSTKVDVGQSKQNSLDNGKAGIISLATANLTVTSVAVNSGSGSCFNFQSFTMQTGTGKNILVQNGTGILFPAFSDGTNLYINNPGTSNFFKVYSSHEFPSSSSRLPGCTALSEGTSYTVGLSKTYPYIFESKILDIFANYTSNYTGLKEAIGVFPGDDFGIKLTYNNGKTVKTPTTNATANIYADSIPIQYVNATSSIQSGFIEVDVW